MLRSNFPKMTCGGFAEARDSALDENALRVVLSESGYPDKQFADAKRGK